MDQIRQLSARPQVIIDPHAKAVGEPKDVSRLGLDGPFGRERVLFALPTGGTGPVRLTAPIVLKDADGCLLADPDPIVVGRDAGVVVSRFLTARWVEDTRRLGG